MSEMKRPALDYAALPDVPVSQMTPAQQLICKVAWISDNAAYGTLEATKLLIDDIRAGSFTGATPRPSARTEAHAPAQPSDNDDLGWALAALDLVMNGLKHDGHVLTDDPTTSSTALWNARAVKVSIENYLAVAAANRRLDAASSPQPTKE